MAIRRVVPKGTQGSISFQDGEENVTLSQVEYEVKRDRYMAWIHDKGAGDAVVCAIRSYKHLKGLNLAKDIIDINADPFDQMDVLSNSPNWSNQKAMDHGKGSGYLFVRAKKSEWHIWAPDNDTKSKKEITFELHPPVGWYSSPKWAIKTTVTNNNASAMVSIQSHNPKSLHGV